MRQIIEFHEQKDKRRSIDCAKTLFDNIKSINIDYDQENFLIFYLNTKNKLIKSEVLFIGSMDTCIIDPKIIFRKALENKATDLILAHNHPSGNLEPSEEDIDMTKAIKAIGRILGVGVLDCVIFNEKEYYSLEESED
jgi:DNA repair protein RadC